MADPIEALGFLDLLLHPRRLGRWIVSQAAQVGFIVIALPIGCGVTFLALFAGFAIWAALVAVGVDTAVTGPFVVVVFAGSLAVAFVALVRLYRAMPKKVRAMIEMAEDGATDGGPAAPLAPARTSATELSALDARLKPPMPPEPGKPPPSDPSR